MFATGIVEAHLDQYQGMLVIPRSAVLWTGKRSIVYVKLPNVDETAFKIREIELGPMLGNSYVVMDGLTDGEEIVTQGAFSVDAAAQLEGKPSMMDPRSSQASIQPETKIPDNDMAVPNPNIKAKYTVYGNCVMCKDRIEKAARSVKGVTKAIWSSKTKVLQVQYRETLKDPDLILKSVAEAGHDNEKYKADDKIYSALPKCCLYR